ncbi:conserved hypothetical protein [Pediculus humanus corporis]|uniref:MaoC-like domain-containing protein n=1 Tax=Pediculus humanus subsp. corporis TaxID=121224 RepID=E0VBX4_PEDHC|nr:uncharacterized protein Phum_PHUM075000 [Pediculus humanus corporis]EEB10880.1 conserved hypothetical protein [Pediculus humanus corporis]
MSTEEKLHELKKEHKYDRQQYLKQLVTEFQVSKHKDVKEQILSNLVNFAYDPWNYDLFRSLKILDLFINNLTDTDDIIVKLSAAGLCNLCIDPLNKDFIVKHGLTDLKKLLNNKHDEIIISVISILMYIITPSSKTDKVSVRRKITSDDVKLYADLTKDHNPIHLDPEQGIVHGAFLNGLVSGIIGTILPGNGTVVVQQNLRFPKPCYVGDEVIISVIVKSIRKIIEVEFFVINGQKKNEQVVLEGSAKLLIPFQQESLKLGKGNVFHPNNYLKGY